MSSDIGCTRARAGRITVFNGKLEHSWSAFADWRGV